MNKFAKIFESDTHGQILLVHHMNRDTQQWEVQMQWLVEGKGLCTVSMAPDQTMPLDPVTTAEQMRLLFIGITKDHAERMLSDMLAHPTVAPPAYSQPSMRTH